MRFIHFGGVPAVLAVVALTLTAACSPKTDSSATTDSAAGQMRDTSAAAGTAAGAGAHDSMGGMQGMQHDSMAMGGMAGMAGMSSMPPEDQKAMRMSGNPDQDFLRMMSDHHKGLIAMAHLVTEEKKGSASAQADATKLDKKQDEELDKMATMLEKQYKDAYDPRIMPSNQAMVDQLKGQSGAQLDRMFYGNVVKHHQMAIKMIDEFVPKMKSAELKQMAEKMKRDQAREIHEFEQKASKG